ncbi:hypothetical protein BKA83DRAFT_682635 [Pisolithus microcarpus]|nr:hypothetical protein BKA83DRAFT_682635 [Pisolithus microcarpus]
MGFFSARKPEEPKHLEPDRSVVQVIRSRFHDIYKTKRWEASPHPSTSHLSRFGLKSPSRRGGDPESRRSRDLSHSPRSPLRSPGHTSPSPRSMPRAHTDVITSSLAQRLNELAAANAEGLLSDDEYRLLRQNIFERLASHSSVPTETPVIPLGSHGQKYSPQFSNNSSQSCVKSGRTPSVRSKASVSSVVSNLFRRSTRRVSGISKEGTASETSSIFSAAPSAFRRRGIPRELRNDDSSRVEVNASSSAISSPSFDGESQHHRGLESMSYRSMSRSVRRLDSPPSSFLNRTAGPKHSHSILTSEALQDDEVKTSRGIRHEIEGLEAEAMRVLDAFNGLELSVLTRSHHKSGHAPLRSPSSIARRNVEHDFFHGSGTSTSGRGTPYHASDADGSSLRSSTSYGTSASQSRSHRPNPLLKPLLSPLVANRKRSASSLSSGAWASPSTASPTLTQPQLRELGSVSSVNLTRQLAPHSVTSIDEESEISVIESELVDVRRRRQEVTARYQDRLEYLRAQLKGAELREKLMRK